MSQSLDSTILRILRKLKTLIKNEFITSTCTSPASFFLNNQSFVVVLPLLLIMSLLAEFRKSNIDLAVASLLKKKEANKNGRLPHGAIRSTILTLKEVGVETDADHLHYMLKRKAAMIEEAPTETTRAPLMEISVNNGHTTISSITTSSNAFNSGDRTKAGRPTGSTIVLNEKKIYIK